MSVESVNETDQYLDKMPPKDEGKIQHHHHHTNIHYKKPYFAVMLAAFSSLGGWFFGLRSRCYRWYRCYEFI